VSIPRESPWFARLYFEDWPSLRYWQFQMGPFPCDEPSSKSQHARLSERAEGIEIGCALRLTECFLAATESNEQHGVPKVCSRIARSQLNGSLKVPFRKLELPGVPQC
jgi:hypothetical protein